MFNLHGLRDEIEEWIALHATATALPHGLLELVWQREFKAAEVAGSPNRHDLPHKPNANQTVVFNVSNGLIEGCHFCRATTNTSRCGACRVVSYCSREHQAIDRAAHKAACSKIKKERAKLEAEEKAIRAHAVDDHTGTNAFQEVGKAMGHFWKHQIIRPHLLARYFLVLALLRVNTKHAVEAALEHGLDMLRLNHEDNQGLRCIIPSLYLRLGRDQDCYDHLVWWLLYGRGDNKHHWGHPDAVVKDYSALDPVADFIKSLPDLSQIVALALVKIRMLIDNASAISLPKGAGFLTKELLS
ncbi:MYND-type zinc finger protein samB [Parastagonospora nodorum]|nr:MYND-type zinc finger protein samB [Parastagonospora nodorum]KAH4318102.1 MYND-type zinc finger protein samB [Parastagonospora nodorum]